MQRKAHRSLGLLNLLALTGLCSVAVTIFVALRHLLATPQPLESILPGEARIYRWKHGHIFYKVLGAQDAPPLVLLHAPGVGASAHEMLKIIEPLAQQYRIYALDLLGFGLSDRPRMDYSAETYISLYRDFLTEVVMQPATLFASGLSCNYAVAVAMSSPDLCERLVLISPTGLFSGGQKPKQSLLGELVPLLQVPAVSFILYALISTRFALRSALGRGRSSYTLSELNHLYATTHQLGARHAPIALLTGKLAKDVSQPFETLQQPVLIIWGAHALNEAHSITSPHQLPDYSQVALIHDTGAHVHQEQPGKVIANMREWSESATTSKPTTQAAEPLAEAVASTDEEGEAAFASIDEEGEAAFVGIGEEAAAFANTTGAEETAFVGSVEESEAAIANASGSEINGAADVSIVAAQMSEMEVTNMSTVEAYCVKCKKKVPMQHPHKVTMKNGRPALQGTCPTCGTGLFRIGGSYDPQESGEVAIASEPATHTAVASTGAESSVAVASEPTVEAYCVKCKKKEVMQHPHKVTMKNGRPALQGTCPTCGTGLFRIGSV